MKRHLVARFASIAMASALLASQVAAVSATVWTDQSDYSPGSVVTISGDNSNGAGYLGGETVHVDVSGPNGYTSSCAAIADGNGAWSCQVTLWDSDLAVGDYAYTATGQTSAVTENGTFTDKSEVTITGVTFVWYTATSFDLLVEGTYTCDLVGPAAGDCNDADDVTVTIHEGDGTNNSATGAVGDRTKVLAVSTTGADVAWSYTFPFRPVPFGEQYLTPSDGQFDIKAIFHGKLSGSARTSNPDVEDNYFGIDTAEPTSTIDTLSAGSVPTATGTAIDPGSTSPVEHFSGFDNGDDPNPMHVEIRTDPGNALVAGSGLDLTLAGLGSTKQSGTWAYDYADTANDPLADGDYCLVAQATDHAGNVQDPVTTECFTVGGGGPVTPTLTTEVRDASTDTPATTFPFNTTVYDHAAVDSGAEGTVDFALYSGSDCTDQLGSLEGSDTAVALVSGAADSTNFGPLTNDGYYFLVDYNSSDTDQWLDTSTCEEFTIGAPPDTLSALSDAHLWIGLKNSDDQGTQFDLYVELLQNGTTVATGLERCITGVTRNPSLATEAIVEWDSFVPPTLQSGDVLALRVSTRIGTNANGTKCSGPGGSHNNAVGLRLYYDSTSRQSRFDATIGSNPNTDLYLRSDGNACVNAESTGVTTRYLSPTAPVAASAKCKDSAGVNFAGGNLLKVIGTWALAALP